MQNQVTKILFLMQRKKPVESDNAHTTGFAS